MGSLQDASLKMDDNVELPCYSATAYAIEIKQRFNWPVVVRLLSCLAALLGSIWTVDLFNLY